MIKFNLRFGSSSVDFFLWGRFVSIAVDWGSIVENKKNRLTFEKLAGWLIKFNLRSDSSSVDFFHWGHFVGVAVDWDSIVENKKNQLSFEKISWLIDKIQLTFWLFIGWFFSLGAFWWYCCWLRFYCREQKKISYRLKKLTGRLIKFNLRSFVLVTIFLFGILVVFCEKRNCKKKKLKEEIWL